MGIHQLKITLEGFEPSIWRMVEMRGNSTFADLHLVIQEAKVWKHSNPYHFRMTEKNKWSKSSPISTLL